MKISPIKMDKDTGNNSEPEHADKRCCGQENLEEKESKWALQWPQNVQYQLYETAKGKQLSKQTLS